MKNLVCLGIDQAPPDWSLWRKVINRDQYFNFDPNTFPTSVHFCNNVLNNKNLTDNIEILGRIGSPSADAEVYKIKFNNLEFAMKIMPRIDKDSSVKNTQELQIAEAASKYSNYFPLTFAKGYCSDSSFYVSENGEVSPFVNKAVEFYSYQRMINQITNKGMKKRFDNDYRSGTNLLELAEKYLTSLNQKNKLDKVENFIEVDFLISELCNMDFGEWMKINHLAHEWKIVLNNILIGIYYMTGFLGIVHPDLHVGNVLINTANKNEPLALIHDFGRCYFITPENNNYKGSLISFCSEFISCSARSDLLIERNVLAAINSILNYVNRTDINRENLQSVYNDVLLPIINDIN